MLGQKRGQRKQRPASRPPLGRKYFCPDPESTDAEIFTGAVESGAVFCYFCPSINRVMLFRKKSKSGDLAFAFFHLAALIAILIYGLIGLARGNYWRFGVIAAGLGVYYFLVLHKGVKAEIARRKKAS